MNGPQHVTKYITNASSMIKLLKGVCVLYKPAGYFAVQTRMTFLHKLCRDLNEMPDQPVAQRVVITGDTTKPMKVSTVIDYSDHPLVIGPRYNTYQFRLSFANNLARDVCGVLVCGLNTGNTLIAKIKNNQPTSSYRIKGVLGYATDNYFKTGRIIQNKKYEHVRREYIDNVCSALQSSHQRKMFELCGVDMQSQAAYELAVQGPIRPADKRIPVVYSIKCVDFNPPEFTIEVISINEYDMHLKAIIHEIGQKVRSAATCTFIQCFQYAVFNLDHSLLLKQWDVEHIANNLQMCEQMLVNNKYLLNQKSGNLVDSSTANVTT